jgi:hypothetical protein
MNDSLSAPLIVMPTEVGIHVFSRWDQSRRGWCAFAHHDAIRRPVGQSIHRLVSLAIHLPEGRLSQRSMGPRPVMTIKRAVSASPVWLAHCQQLSQDTTNPRTRRDASERR